MANLIYFQPSSELKAKNNLDEFIVHCRENLTLYEEQGGFNSNKWKHQFKNSSITMLFSKYRINSHSKKYELLEEPFLSFAKAYIRYTQSVRAVTSVAHVMKALRILHDALLEVHLTTDILKIDGLTLGKLQELTNLRIQNNESRNKTGYMIVKILDFIRDNRIAPTLQVWKNPWLKVAPKAERTDKESRDWQETRCPSMHQMLTLADCFANAVTAEDKILV